MTKARDLANIANGVPNSLITLDANEIPNLDTAKITTGTFADARISSSSVSQHATSFDDSKIQQDLMVLALQQATDANKAAYSLSNSFIEQFEDNTGIDVQTNTSRNTSEYVGTISETIGSTLNTYGNADMNITLNNFYFYGGGQSMLFDGALNPTGGGAIYADLDTLGAGASTLSPTVYAQFELNNIIKINNFRLHSWSTPSRVASCKFHYSLNGSTWNYWNVNGSENASGTASSSSNVTWGNSNAWGQHTDNSGGTIIKYIRFVPQSGHNNGSNLNSGISEIQLQGYTYSLTANSTGNFTSVSKTAPATVSKMGIVVLYKNNAGTTTLNTDLVAQVSANNGTDYTTVTLTPRGTFSTGINIAVANNVTVTSGTSCKYKISFANQSAGTKETQVHGVGLIY